MSLENQTYQSGNGSRLILSFCEDDRHSQLDPEYWYKSNGERELWNLVVDIHKAVNNNERNDEVDIQFDDNE